MGFDFQERTNKLLKRLRWLGCWFTDDVFSCNLYSLYVIGVLIYYNLHNIVQLVYLFLHVNDLSEWATSGLLVFVEFFTNVKFYGIIANKSKILKLNAVVSKAKFQPRNAQQEERIRSIFQIFDYLYIFHCIGPTLTCVFFGLYPITDIRSGHKRLPFNAWYPFEFRESPAFQLTYVHQITAALIQAQTQVHTDCLSTNLIAVLIAQVEILADNLRQIKKNNSMEKELLECIFHHKEIFQDVYKILNLIMFGQFLISSVSLCFALLELVTVSPGSAKFMALIIYEFALMGELFMFCWWGNVLIESSLNLPQAAFESDWLEGSIRFRKTLCFLIFRTQREMALYAVDFFKISLSSFILILKNSYSFYAVLHHANNNKLSN